VPETSSAVNTDLGESPTTLSARDSFVESEREPLTQRYLASEPSLFLEIAQDTLLSARSGWRLGQAHSSSDAEIQLPARVPGVEFVHRHHCRFDYAQGRWYVTALDQHSLAHGFTNPTQVKGRFLSPGERAELTDGDELRLSGVILWVRMPPVK
jgi:hypothetical protein